MKKKRIFSIIAALVLTCSIGLSAGCGEVDQGIDKNKTQIYVSVYNGGTGTEWIKDLATEFNKTNAKYQIMISAAKISTSDIITQIQSGNVTKTTPSVYYTGESGFQTLIYQDKLEDLSDLCAKEIDGVGNGTLKDKIGASEDYFDTVWKNVATKNGEGIYMLPYADSFGGLIFDYETFLEEGFLNYAANNSATKEQLTAQGIEFEAEGARLIFTNYTGNDIYFNYEQGDTILTAGKDGKFGSYDDGQPTTIAEWDAMLAKITSKNMKPFLWTGQYPEYVDMITEAYMAQYAGLKEFNTYFTFDGSVTIGGEKVTITPDNGYQVYGMDGYGKAIEFVDKYFNDASYYHTETTFSKSHKDAQAYYILGYRQEKDQPMMLVDGEWFENEARAMFNNSSVVAAGRGYGKREYRFMLLPKIEGSYGLDGNGNGSVLSVLNSGTIIVPKCSDAEKLATIKDFIAYTLTDEALSSFTVRTGIANAYDYSLTSEQLAQMTPFARNVFQMYHDNDNIGFARAPLLYASSPMRFVNASGFYKQKIIYVANKNQYDGAIKALRVDGVTPQIMANDAKNYYKSATNPQGQSFYTWEQLLASAREAGFYPVGQ